MTTSEPTSPPPRDRQGALVLVSLAALVTTTALLTTQVFLNSSQPSHAATMSWLPNQVGQTVSNELQRQRGELSSLMRQTADQRQATPVAPRTLDSVAVLPFHAPEDIHDGVKWHLSRWVSEVPRRILDDAKLRVAMPRRVAMVANGINPELTAIEQKTPKVPPRRLKLTLTETEELRRAGRMLKVATVLAGEVTVEDDGASLIVEAELVEVDTGLLLWTKRWELREIGNKNEFLERVGVELGEGVRKRLGI